MENKNILFFRKKNKFFDEIENFLRHEGFNLISVYADEEYKCSVNEFPSSGNKLYIDVKK